MFCYQCEQTKLGTGCDKVGTCGKTPETSVLQDLLLEVAAGISRYAHRLRGLGVATPEADAFVIDALFTTVTNVNFDADRTEELIKAGDAVWQQVRQAYGRACAAAGRSQEAVAGLPVDPKASRGVLVAAGETLGIAARQQQRGADVVGLQELLVYGIKGVAAYGRHARVLGRDDAEVTGFLHEAMDFVGNPSPAVSELVSMALRCGEATLKVMALLDGANTGSYGAPVPTPVLMGHKAGKAILVSGHDLKDLAELLEQTAGTGINVYTHGEMLPAHGYPELKRHAHLAGHFGGAWQDQQKDFAAFPGPVLMTTNCLMPTKSSYHDRVFTTGVVAGVGLRHIPDTNFAAVIESAKATPGFASDSEPRWHTAGFGHSAVLGVADVVVDAVKKGAIKRFVLIGGCDAGTPGRDYYTKLGEAVPKDWAVLTLGCGKFRLLDTDFGTIGGLPRLLDMGQCNDAFSAIKVAGALAEVFGCGVNDLPLSLVLSWYEQKAVAVLLALLHLGVRNIRVGPSLPAFVTPAALQVLVDTFNVMPIGTVEGDIEAMSRAA
jgi:hydroxylamine reductase